VNSTLERGREAVRTMAGEAERRSRLNLTALWIAVGLVAVGPLAFTLLRADDYKSSATISFNAANPSAADLPRTGPGSPAQRLIEAPLATPEMQKAMARKVGWFDTPEKLPDYVSVEKRQTDSRPVFVVTARGPGPEEARELAFATSTALNQTADGRAGFIRPLQLKRLTSALRRDQGLSDAERTDLRERRAALASAIRVNKRTLALEPTKPTLANDKPADRLVGALPGSRPLRPNPLWAAAAGLALAAALALWVLVLSSGRGAARRP
jgi:hypothetical protein